MQRLITLLVVFFWGTLTLLEASVYTKAVVGYQVQSPAEKTSATHFDPGVLVGLAVGKKWDPLKLELELAVRANEATSGCCETCHETETYGVGALLCHLIYEQRCQTPLSYQVGLGAGLSRNAYFREFFSESETGVWAAPSFEVLGGVGYDIGPCRTFGIEYRFFGSSINSLSCEEAGRRLFLLSHSLAFTFTHRF